MHHLSLIKLFTSFAMLGAEWVMWTLVGLSLVSISIMVERGLYFRSIRDDLNVIADRMAAALRIGDASKAAAVLAGSPSPAAAIAAAGLLEVHRGPEAAERIMGAMAARVRVTLDRNLTVINTIGSNAPFVGLFGTVIGIIQAFDALKTPAGARGAAAAAASAAASGRVMGTIAEALVATAIGLLVAIPAVAAYNYFQRRIKSLMANTEVLTELVLAHAQTRGPDEDLGSLVRLLRGGDAISTRANDAPEVEYAHTDIDEEELPDEEYLTIGAAVEGEVMA